MSFFSELKRRNILRVALACLILTVLILSGCATSADSEKKAADLEYKLARTYGVSGTAFSPDGGQVAVGTRDKIWVADTASLKVTASLSHLDAARFGGRKSLQFIDNQRIVTGAEGMIVIWDLAEKQIIHRLALPVENYSPQAIAWSESTRMLAYSSGIPNSPVKVVHIGEDGFGPIRDLPGFAGVPADLQFSRDGRYLAATGDGEGVFIREVETGAAVGELPTEGLVTDLELFGSNQLLVSGANIAFWAFLDGSEADELENPDLAGQVNEQVLLDAGRIALAVPQILLASFFGVGFLLPSLHAVPSGVKTEQQAWCGRSTAISADGKWLVDIYPGITKEVIRVFELGSENKYKNLSPKGEYSCSVSFSPNGTQLLITSDKAVRLYETGTWNYHELDLGEK